MKMNKHLAANIQTITGQVVDQRTGRGVEGVVVSDGLSVVRTDQAGSFVIVPHDRCRFVFISTPGQYEPVGAFYRDITKQEVSSSFEFVLKASPVGDSFYFGQFTDIHLNPTMNFKAFAKNRLRPEEQLAVVIGSARALGELQTRPQFIAMTGDVAIAIHACTLQEGKEKIEEYVQARNEFELQTYDVIGNHDHLFAGLSDSEMDSKEYGRGLFESHLGPTYYSFNCGKWHFIVLNNYEVLGRTQRVCITESQLQWLKADLQAVGSSTPCLVFMHELLADIGNRDELLAITEKYNIRAFVSGHFHANMDYQYRGVRCIVTGAMCAGWWWRKQWSVNRGYGLFQINGQELSHFYATCGDPNAVQIMTPESWSVVRGEVELTAAVLEINGSPATVTCQIGDGHDFQPMTKAGDGPWPVWKHRFDSSDLEEGSVCLTIRTVNRYGRTEDYRRYIVVKNQETPISSNASELLFTIKGSQGPSQVMLNGKQIGTVPYPTSEDTPVSISVPASSLHRVNLITFLPAALANGGDPYDTFWFNELRIRYEGREYARAGFRPHLHSLVNIERDDLRVTKEAICIIPSAEDVNTMVTLED